jgi:hypothetical protein
MRAKATDSGFDVQISVSVVQPWSGFAASGDVTNVTYAGVTAAISARERGFRSVGLSRLPFCHQL